LRYSKRTIICKNSLRLKRVILRMIKLQILFIQRPLRNYLPKIEEVWYFTEKLKKKLQKFFQKKFKFQSNSTLKFTRFFFVKWQVSNWTLGNNWGWTTPTKALEGPKWSRINWARTGIVPRDFWILIELNQSKFELVS
jgi:hypothetical protein